jgi:hypothetical protein
MMQKLGTALLATIVLTWMPSFSSATEIPGLQFAIQPGTGDFVQFQTGAIIAGKPIVVSYDSLRLASPANPGCSDFNNQASVTGYAMSDNSGKPTSFRVSGSFLKFGKFEAPECHKGSEELQIWFVGKDDQGNQCYDSAFGNNYKFPVICP